MDGVLSNYCSSALYDFRIYFASHFTVPGYGTWPGIGAEGASEKSIYSILSTIRWRKLRQSKVPPGGGGISGGNSGILNIITEIPGF